MNYHLANGRKRNMFFGERLERELPDVWTRGWAVSVKMTERINERRNIFPPNEN